jgi:hypothetical protein
MGQNGTLKHAERVMAYAMARNICFQTKAARSRLARLCPDVWSQRMFLTRKSMIILGPMEFTVQQAKDTLVRQ